MQNEISGQNGPKDMVSFSFKVIFKFYKMIITVSVHYLWGLTGPPTLKPHHTLYTWCTMVISLWHVEWNIWNLLVQTACLYTSCKWGKRVLKMIVCIPCEDRSIRDFCTRSYLLLVYSWKSPPWSYPEIQNEICGQNGPKDMVNFSFEGIF